MREQFEAGDDAPTLLSHGHMYAEEAVQTRHCNCSSDANKLLRPCSILLLSERRQASRGPIMRHLRQAQVVGKDERSLTLDCGFGTTCRIVAVTDEVVRVLFLQGGAPREPRSWMVLGQLDVPTVIDCKTSTAPVTPPKCGSFCSGSC